MRILAVNVLKECKKNKTKQKTKKIGYPINPTFRNIDVVLMSITCH